MAGSLPNSLQVLGFLADSSNMSKSTRLDNMKRKARARLVRSYAIAAGFFPSAFFYRNCPDGAGNIRFAFNGWSDSDRRTVPGRSRDFRLRLPSPEVTPM